MLTFCSLLLGPLRKGMQCDQGILDLAPNGPKGGGLILFKNSSKLNELFCKTHIVKEGNTWGPADWHDFSQENVHLFQAKGCEMVKVCADPGDLVLWESRTVHYNVLRETDDTRAVMCKGRPLINQNIAADQSRYLLHSSPIRVRAGFARESQAVSGEGRNRKQSFLRVEQKLVLILEDSLASCEHLQVGRKASRAAFRRSIR